MQAAALHGSLSGYEKRAKPGFAVALRNVTLATRRLDDPAHGALQVEARRLLSGASGCTYRFRISGEGGTGLVEGEATIAFLDQGER